MVLGIYETNRFASGGNAAPSRRNCNGSLKRLVDFLLTEDEESLTVHEKA